jgi:hypothetical protein
MAYSTFLNGIMKKEPLALPNGNVKKSIRTMTLFQFYFPNQVNETFVIWNEMFLSLR